MDAKFCAVMFMLISGLLLSQNEAVPASYSETTRPGRHFAYKLKSVSKRAAKLSPPPSPKLRIPPSYTNTPPPPVDT
ncbi:hypothetical protein V6N12_015540 [Hibiscus sabdariffa]|uniref:Uncharacterized protein n=1 Tax=Hibiscus sabdariffa TaxID=183260 RepID=A0ABR2DNG2_9ROSI